jgi:hypothetical protein
MAFYADDRIRDNNLDFLYDFTYEAKKELALSIRESEERNQLVKNSYKKGFRYHQFFYFEIVYDMEEYEAFTKKYLEKNNFNCLDEIKISNLIKNTKFGMKFIFENIDKFYDNDKILNLIIFNILINFGDQPEYIKILSLHPNLNLRHLFMKNLISFNSTLIPQVYDDITKYFTSYTYKEFEQMTFAPELMEIDAIQEILIKMIKNDMDNSIIKKTRDFILNNYKENDLASIFFKNNLEELIENPDAYFKSASNNKIYLYKNIGNKLSEEISLQFERLLHMYDIDGLSNKVVNRFRNLDYFGLLNIINKLTEKYMDLSTDKTFGDISGGSTTSSYRIGDYCFKLSDMKWSYEDIICPNDFMFIKNLEEIMIRNKDTNFVEAAIEVQQFLSKPVDEASGNAVFMLLKAIEEKGYYYNDSLKSCNGPNAYFLKHYHDADCDNPESLPDWFKKEPLVITDRDRVYKKDDKFIKQIKYGY